MDNPDLGKRELRSMNIYHYHPISPYFSCNIFII
jgi:hypothetical protein